MHGPWSLEQEAGGGKKQEQSVISSAFDARSKRLANRQDARIKITALQTASIS